MGKMICACAEFCGSPFVLSDKKAEVPICPHQIPHDEMSVCKNPVCKRVMPKNAACIPVPELISPEVAAETFSETTTEVLAAEAAEIVV